MRSFILFTLLISGFSARADEGAKQPLQPQKEKVALPADSATIQADTPNPSARYFNCELSQNELYSLLKALASHKNISSKRFVFGPKLRINGARLNIKHMLDIRMMLPQSIPLTFEIKDINFHIDKANIFKIKNNEIDYDVFSLNDAISILAHIREGAPDHFKIVTKSCSLRSPLKKEAMEIFRYLTGVKNISFYGSDSTNMLKSPHFSEFLKKNKDTLKRIALSGPITVGWLKNFGSNPACDPTVLKNVLSQVPNLTSLSLNHTSIDHAGVTTVASILLQLKNLKNFSLQRSTLDEAQAKILANALSQLPKLQGLDFCNHTIGDAGATALADALKHSSKLKSLRLGWNKITDTGATALVDVLSKLPYFESLDLSHNNISDKGKAMLKDICSKKGIKLSF